MLLWIGRSFTIPPPSNNPPPINIPWLAGPDDHCKECDAREDLAHCNVCGIPVCGRHRAGTGSLDDGYSCSEHFFYPFDAKPTPKQVIVARKHKFIEMVKVDPFMATMCCIVYICLALLFFHMFTGWPMQVQNVR